MCSLIWISKSYTTYPPHPSQLLKKNLVTDKLEGYLIYPEQT